MSAQESFNTARSIMENARFKTFGSTEDLLNHLAWGNRAWLIGEADVASKVDDILSLLQRIEKRLDSLERSRGLSR